MDGLLTKLMSINQSQINPLSAASVGEGQGEVRVNYYKKCRAQHGLIQPSVKAERSRAAAASQTCPAAGGLAQTKEERQPMKNFLMILGGVVLVLVVLAIAGIAIVAVKGSGLDKVSKRYADDAIPAIISKWEVEELELRASPKFKSAMKDSDLEQLFGVFRRLGKLKEYKGCQGEANISISPEQGTVISAAYLGSAEFEKGPAEIRLSLIKEGDRWQILGFRVESKVFLEKQ